MRDYATIVSGLCRSGTSMLMNMLVVGGLEPVMDEQVSEPDKYNPFGYFEAEIEWNDITEQWVIENCLGKVVKIVAPYIIQAGDAPMRVVYPMRDLKDVARECSRVAIDLVHSSYNPCTDRHLAELSAGTIYHLQDRKIPVLPIKFELARREPIIAAVQLNEFLGGLDVMKMAKVPKSPAVMQTIRRRWHETAQQVENG